MKRYIYSLSVFALIVFTIFSALNLFHGYYSPDCEHYKLQYDEVKQKKVKANGIIIGASHGTHSIRPSLLDKTGYKFYNFCLNGANPDFYLKWYEQFFSFEYQKPEYCIYTVDWGMFDQRLWRMFEKDSEYFSFKLLIKLLCTPKKFSTKDLLYNRFPVIKYRNRFKKSFQLKKGDETMLSDDYDRGFIAFYLPPDSMNFIPGITPLSTTIIDEQKWNFEKLVQRLKSDGIKLIFVMTPEYNIDPKEYKLSEAMAIINTVAEKYNIPFINYNTIHRCPEISNNLDNFSDWGHMSQSGSIVFSKMLEKDLSNIMQNTKPPAAFYKNN